MRQYLLKAMGLLACVGLLSTHSLAQENKGKLGENDEIVIRKKGDKNTRIVLEIKDGEVQINGKPMSEFNDDNLVVIRKKRFADGRARAFVAPVPPVPPGSPFRGGNWNFDEESFRHFGDPQKPFLGVLSEKSENGVKITAITKGSAAEKAGLKEGDIITRVNDTKITSPEELSKTIGSFKPEEKVTITINSKDKKEQKVSATLGKRPGAARIFPEGFELNEDLDLDLDMITPPGHEGFEWRQDGRPKLGIKAQDLEDGKGAKVLNVDDASNAQKAGIKEGDIITEFDGTKVENARELAEAARNAKDKSSITIKLTRDGKSQDVEVKIPKKLKTATL